MSAFDKAFWCAPQNAWFKIASTLFRATAVGHDGSYSGQEEFEPAMELEDAGLVTSIVRRDGGLTGTHKVAIDLDMPAALVPSSTEGHYHLYIDHEMPWEAYENLLAAFEIAGILEPGYVHAAMDRGYTSLRTPWTRKPGEVKR
jgi:hypothetical protein